MHLCNTRICRYTCIYITPTVQTLHYCPAGAWRWNDIVLISMWRYHVASTSFWRHVPAGCDQDRRVKAVQPWKWNLPCSVRCISNKIWTQMTSGETVYRYTDKPRFELWKNWTAVRFLPYRFFAIPKLFLYASELLISRKFCQTSIIFQRKNNFAELTVDCFCGFFFDGGVTGV